MSTPVSIQSLVELWGVQEACPLWVNNSGTLALSGYIWSRGLESLVISRPLRGSNSTSAGNHPNFFNPDISSMSHMPVSSVARKAVDHELETSFGFLGETLHIRYWPVETGRLRKKGSNRQNRERADAVRGKRYWWKLSGRSWGSNLRRSARHMAGVYARTDWAVSRFLLFQREYLIRHNRLTAFKRICRSFGSWQIVSSIAQTNI